MLCFYHRADFDGKASAAIVAQKHPEVELIGIDYGDPFPWDRVQLNDIVFMVDFSLSRKEMDELDDRCHLVWIDHHKTALEWIAKSEHQFKGKREVGKAGCELTWQYCFPELPMPDAVKYLGRYDVWQTNVFIEQLVDIPGYEGLYSISNTGRVFRHNDPGWQVPSESSSGYLQVQLSKNGDKRVHSIHRLVAEAFIPRQNDLQDEVNHKDGNKHNDRSDNLEWVTRHGNMAHAKREGNLEGTSSFLGVGYHSGRNRWRARVSYNGRRWHVGWFTTEIEAARAYDRFVSENEMAGVPLNFPQNKPIEIQAPSDHWNTIILPFQYGMRFNNPDVNDRDFWRQLFAGQWLEQIFGEGRICKQYSEQAHAGICSYAAYEMTWEGLRWICINGPYRSSQVFDSVFDPAKHDGMMAYSWNGQDWRFGLYTNKKELDLSPIAKKYGGGGHAGACGFQVKRLPFNLGLGMEPPSTHEAALATLDRYVHCPPGQLVSPDEAREALDALKEPTDDD